MPLSTNDFIALVGAAAGVVGALAGLLTVNKIWLRWLIGLTGIVVVAATALTIPATFRERLFLSALFLITAAIGSLLWYAVNWLLDRPPRQEFELMIRPGQSIHIIGTDDPALRLDGTYVGQARAVRAVLENDAGGFHVQNPEVELRPDGTWSATNLIPRRGIAELHLVLLGFKGKRYFDELVRRSEFGAVPLPKNCRSVATVPVTQMAAS